MDLGTNLSSPKSQVSSELPTQPSPQNATRDPAKLTWENMGTWKTVVRKSLGRDKELFSLSSTV